MRCRPKLPHFFGLALLLLMACDNRKPEMGFYFWRSGSPMSEDEITYLEESGAALCYIRLTDITLNPQSGTISPAGFLPEIPQLPDQIEAIPVIYIQNQVFLAGYEPEYLSEMLWLGIGPDFEKYGFQELQIDCDWTQSSREDYFHFLDLIKQRLGERDLSVTIRLHQSKYPDITGVPPADRGMLMFYNMSDLTDLNTRNYIYDPEIADDYLVDFNSYPLPLDVALPIYSQGVWIRNGKVIGLLTGINKTMVTSSGHWELENGNIFSCVKEGFFQSEYLNVGDQLRLEVTKPKTIQESAEMLAPYFGKSPSRVVFYHLDDAYLNTFSYADLHRALKPFY